MSSYVLQQEIEEPTLLFPPGAFAIAIPFPDGVTGNPEFDESRWRGEFSAVYTGMTHHRWQFGAGYQYAAIDSVRETKNFTLVLLDTPAGPTPVFVPLGGVVDVTDTPFVALPEGDRQSGWLFVQDEWQLSNSWQATAGIRYDNYTDFGDSTNPRVALIWNGSREFSSKLMYGTAFRAPSWTELYAINNPVILGNPELQPETLNNWELAFDYRPDPAWRLALNVFDYHIEDGIAYLPGPAGLTAQNTNQIDGHGGEFEFSWRPDAAHWQLLGNVSYQSSENSDTGAAIGNAPNWRNYLRFDWQFIDDWHADLQWTHVGERERPAGDSRSALEGYDQIDAQLRWFLNDRLQLTLNLRNVLDADIREPASANIPDDLPMAGRNGNVELRLKF